MCGFEIYKKLSLGWNHEILFFSSVYQIYIEGPVGGNTKIFIDEKADNFINVFSS